MSRYLVHIYTFAEFLTLILLSDLLSYSMAPLIEENPSEAAAGDEIKSIPAQQSHIERKATYDPDDIHQAALADNPSRAERPSLSTILSIIVS